MSLERYKTMMNEAPHGTPLRYRVAMDNAATLQQARDVWARFLAGV